MLSAAFKKIRMFSFHHIDEKQEKGTIAFRAKHSWLGVFLTADYIINAMHNGNGFVYSRIRTLCIF